MAGRTGTRRLIVVIIAMSMIYGLCMGSYSLLKDVPPEQLVLAGEQGRPAVAKRQLALDLVGVQQVQALGQVRFARTFAFAGAARFRPAEDPGGPGR